jgi:hypothetical protein
VKTKSACPPGREIVPSLAGRCGFDDRNTERAEFLGYDMTDERFVFGDKNPDRR